MQTDEEVGKVAQAVPIIISRTLELFVHSLLTKTMQITSAKNAKTLSPSHMKQCILSESRFDFLKDLVKGIPDVAGPDEDVPTPPLTPAPISVNISNATTCPPAGYYSDRSSQNLLLNDIKVEPKVFKTEERITNSNINPSSDISTVCATPQAPEFQISVPASYQISQPNFYTEVNPMNSSSNSDSSTTNHPTSKFTHTANIDEDYDT
ncbi:PREDICTED: DNA polymerase epsilon subunit C isoform X2 [Polistes dominula]|nr:PREDICTED: DNA polymerase epsilon subunit C isoform X2 [Polistes dominula]